MHRLGTSVLMLIILPLAFSCESGQNKNQITQEYRNIIMIQLNRAEDITDQLNSNCTTENASMLKEPKNAQHSLHRKICKINGKLSRIRETENVTKQLKDVLDRLGEEIHTSLRCQCHRKRERTPKPKLKIRKWNLCRVKDILANLQRHYEQYNVY
ncbi:hypothetical protein QQF64_021946 [Cirrhinus molitorella]|uniref:Uncharacterized protein n=2 Tax=Cirrhinus molitorella TaxID=172907 RepID=A0ABR3LAR9_9TELE|nr:hypothetical protein Q8A67_024486 [Cirrhinus molitorella]